MNKVICDICGSQYPETERQCPICGYVRPDAAEIDQEELDLGETQAPKAHVKGGRFSEKNVRKRNKEAQHQAPKGQNEKPKKQKKNKKQPKSSSVGTRIVNVLLVIVILALLAVSGYIFMQYFMPRFMAPATEPTTAPTQMATEATLAPTDPVIPCTALNVKPDYKADLTKIGDATLLNVEVVPANTTDKLTYTSSDETVVVVSTEGRVTAVGEGAATVTVRCGNVEVMCSFTSGAAVETPTAEPTAAPTAAPTEEPTKPLKDVTLAIDKKEFALAYKGNSYTLRLKCDLEPHEVTWYSDNEKVATIDENGKVTETGKGSTKVYAKYGDQIVECKVYCR